ALIISDRAGVEVVKESRLIMERDLGVLTGKPVDHICKYADGTFEVDDFTYFLKARGAEEIPSCYKRAKKFLSKLSGYDSDSIVVVAHGGIGQMIRAVYNGWSWKKGLKFSHLENGEAMLLGGS
ncbi:MAG: histidine phosphatase family protein, partial [Candidatus Magasanikbacteria bacterium]